MSRVDISETPFLQADEQGGFGLWASLSWKVLERSQVLGGRKLRFFRAGFFLGSNDNAGGRRHATS